jgi:hypothetical protein
MRALVSVKTDTPLPWPIGLDGLAQLGFW